VAEESAAALRNPDNRGILRQVADAVRTCAPEATEDAVCRWVDLGTREVSQRFWCLDPIDGTKGFLRGEQYAVALALVLEGRARLGVLACPNLPHNLARPQGPRGVIFLALSDQGAYQMGLAGGNAVPVRTSGPSRRADLRFCESVEPGHSDHEGQARVAARLGITAPPVRMDSQAKYGIVARGDAAIYLRLPNPGTPDYREKIWDHAAGTVIVEEAGGRVTDLTGKPLEFGLAYRFAENTGVVATSGAVHERVLDALRP
jgi:3'(2'), 5'-bisphosphate nucleotidase